MDKNHYVYGYLRQSDSEHGPEHSLYYIGKGKGHRKYSRQRGVHRPTDDRYIVTIAENMTEADAFQLEVLLIHLWGRIDLGTGLLRNRTDGGEGTTKVLRPRESYEKVRLINIGSKRSPESKARMSAAAQGRPSSRENIRKAIASNIGRPCSEATKRKISAAHKGRKHGPHTQEHREKIRAAQLGKKRGPYKRRLRDELEAAA